MQKHKIERRKWIESINEMLKTADDMLIKTVWYVLDCNKPQEEGDGNE